jgi:hypothetical protein
MKVTPEKQQLLSVCNGQPTEAAVALRRVLQQSAKSHQPAKHRGSSPQQAERSRS